jgi:hypothetical protein
MAREPRQGDLEDDLAGSLRPAILLLGLFETFQLAPISTRIPESSGPTAISARITLSFAARTSSRKLAAPDGADRRPREDGAGASQFDVTRGLICANQ